MYYSDYKRRKLRRRILNKKKDRTSEKEIFEQYDRLARNYRKQVIMNLRMHENDPYLS
jgi:hypothetical protein